VIQDPTRLAPEIRAYIEAENNYAERVLAPLSTSRAGLVAEMKRPVEQNDTGMPVPAGAYAYWQKYVPGAEHPQLVRAPRSGGAEELLVDGAALAKGRAYFKARRRSPQSRPSALRLSDRSHRRGEFQPPGSAISRPGAISRRRCRVSGFAWASDSRTLFYVRLDADHRARLVYRHTIGSELRGRCAHLPGARTPVFDVSIMQARSGPLHHDLGHDPRHLPR